MIQPQRTTPWQLPDPTQYAAMSFLARYRGATPRAYTEDLHYYLRWCVERRDSAGPCSTPWSLLRCSPRPGATGPAHTPWSRCSA